MSKQDPKDGSTSDASQRLSEMQSPLPGGRLEGDPSICEVYLHVEEVKPSEISDFSSTVTSDGNYFDLESSSYRSPFINNSSPDEKTSDHEDVEHLHLQDFKFVPQCEFSRLSAFHLRISLLKCRATGSPPFIEKIRKRISDDSKAYAARLNVSSIVFIPPEPDPIWISCKFCNNPTLSAQNLPICRFCEILWYQPICIHCMFFSFGCKCKNQFLREASEIDSECYFLSCNRIYNYTDDELTRVHHYNRQFARAFGA